MLYFGVHFLQPFIKGAALLFFSEELDSQRGPFKNIIRNQMLMLLRALEDKTLGNNQE